MAFHEASNSYRLAVLLRQKGATLSEAARQSGLSVPTVAELVRVYDRGGWDAIAARRRGRPKSGSHRDAALFAKLRDVFLGERKPVASHGPVFSAKEFTAWFAGKVSRRVTKRTALKTLSDWKLLPPDRPRCAGVLETDGRHVLLWARGPRGELFLVPTSLPLTDGAYCDLFEALRQSFPKGFSLSMQFAGLRFTPQLKAWLDRYPEFQLDNIMLPRPASDEREFDNESALLEEKKIIKGKTAMPTNQTVAACDRYSYFSLAHLRHLEAESIGILREVVAEADNPVMLYSIGKDSAVMLHLAVKAFYPAKIPFPLLHVDTTWKFQDMYRFRERMQREKGFNLLIHSNQDGLRQGINPFTHGSQIHTDIMKTVALRQALDQHQFDVAFGGGRRDEEQSRAKERIFSFRSKDHRWDSKNQRPELWSLYNTHKNKGESIRVFPISNWTELDIWQYVRQENIPIVPLYFSAPRPVVDRDGTLIMVDDERMPLAAGEVPMIKNVRFRTLGCYPLTGAIESEAANLDDVIEEMRLSTTSERGGRVIDHDSAASMERKKQEGYF